jgi:hypothetical protein
MKITRKNFLKLSGLAGMGMFLGSGKTSNKTIYSEGHQQNFNMHGFAVPKMDVVRMGFLGIGSRGAGVVMRFAQVEGIEIKALCDIVPDRVLRVKDRLKGLHDPEAYTDNENSWKALCERKDIDLIIIATPWDLHAPQAIYSMQHGKHVAIEIPGVKTMEECWSIVETSEKTRKHCTLMANSAYGEFNLLTLNMARKGFFGEIIHGEGAYIHDRVSDPGRWNRDAKNNYWFSYRPWRLRENINRDGNLYAAHGLGTICQVMDINYGDKMDTMVSMSSNDFTMSNKMKDLAGKDEYYKPFADVNFRGNINTSIIRTSRGRTIMLQHDISSPRPNVRFNMISGTKGIIQLSPSPAKISTGHEWLSEEEFQLIENKYKPEIINKIGDMAKERGGHGGTDTLVAWRIIDCLRNGIPLDIDVYDAALWSSIVPLSEWSVANGSQPVKVPDFTSGAWKTNKRGMDIELKNGGTTRLI